jgi:hypothetical protein
MHKHQSIHNRQLAGISSLVIAQCCAHKHASLCPIKVLDSLRNEHQLLWIARQAVFARDIRPYRISLG